MWISTHAVHKYQQLAHNSQNYQHHKSLELGIMKRVVLVFVILFLLCCCCSPVVQQGCCPFVHSFVVKACYDWVANGLGSLAGKVGPCGLF